VNPEVQKNCYNRLCREKEKESTLWNMNVLGQEILNTFIYYNMNQTLDDFFFTKGRHDSGLILILRSSRQFQNHN